MNFEKGTLFASHLRLPLLDISDRLLLINIYLRQKSSSETLLKQYESLYTQEIKNRQHDFDTDVEKLKQCINEKVANINSMELKIKSLENQQEFGKFASFKTTTIPRDNLTNNNSLSNQHQLPPFKNLTNIDYQKTKRLQQPAFLDHHINSGNHQCISSGGNKSRNFHYNSRLGFKKFPFQCDICDWSTQKRDGINIHKAKEHGCNYKDEYGIKCPNIQCKLHRLLFDPTNSNGQKFKKAHECDMCECSFDSNKGLSTHKGLIHRCKYRDNRNRHCTNFNCEEHSQEYIYEIVSA